MHYQKIITHEHDSRKKIINMDLLETLHYSMNNVSILTMNLSLKNCKHRIWIQEPLEIYFGAHGQPVIILQIHSNTEYKKQIGKEGSNGSPRSISEKNRKTWASYLVLLGRIFSSKLQPPSPLQVALAPRCRSRDESSLPAAGHRMYLVWPTGGLDGSVGGEGWRLLDCIIAWAGERRNPSAGERNPRNQDAD